MFEFLKWVLSDFMRTLGFIVILAVFGAVLADMIRAVRGTPKG